MPHYLIFTFVASALAACSPRLPGNGTLDRRPVCTVSRAGSAVDSAEEFALCLQACGNGGIIRFSSDLDRYVIGSPLNFTGCNNCEIQVETTLRVTDNFPFWYGKDSAISLSGITNAKIHSVNGTGRIDGNGGWLYRSDCCHREEKPLLLQVTNSTGITISNLKFENAARDFLRVEGGSSNISLSSLTFKAVDRYPYSDAYFDDEHAILVRHASDVRINNTNVTIEAKDGGNPPGTCITIADGASSVSVNNLSCKAGNGALIQFNGSPYDRNNTGGNARDISFTNARLDTSIASGINSGGSLTAISNVTWDNFVVLRGAANVVRSCYPCGSSRGQYEQREANWKLTDIWFRNFSGSSVTPYSFSCPAKATCDIHYDGFSNATVA